MRYNIPDIDRTLLSAYLDGEVSAGEAVRAEALLASSEEARNYLRELRAVDTLSAQAFVMPAAGAAAVPLGASAIAGKLTGSAIQAAAARAAVTKAVTFGSWGLAGVVGTAAAVAVGAALMLQSPKQILGTSGTKQYAPAPVHAAQQRIAQPVNIDTNNLIVPPMTSSDLLAFAVHGTLPINANRSRFITVAAKGKDSVSLCVHSKAPTDIDQSVAAIDVDENRMLDSIQRVIRTSIIHAKEGIALRSDIPSLRLGVIRSFEQAAPRMPMAMRQRLDRTRLELERTRVELDRTSVDLDAMARTFGSAPDGSGPIILDGQAQVVYRMIPAEGLFADERDEFFTEPPVFVFNFDNEPLFTVDQHSLRVLQAHVADQRSSLSVQVGGIETAEQPHIENNPSGVRINKRKATAESGFMTPQPSGPAQVWSGVGNRPEHNGNLIDRSSDSSMNRTRVVMRRNDSLLMEANDAIREVNRRMRVVDSMMRQFQDDVKKKVEQSQRNGGTQSESSSGFDGTSVGSGNH